MAEVALIHILKLILLMVRLQVASIQMSESTKETILASVEDSESFFQNYIDSKDNKRVGLSVLPKLPKKEYMN